MIILFLLITTITNIQIIYELDFLYDNSQQQYLEIDSTNYNLQKVGVSFWFKTFHTLGESSPIPLLEIFSFNDEYVYTIDFVY